MGHCYVHFAFVFTLKRNKNVNMHYDSDCLSLKLLCSRNRLSCYCHPDYLFQLDRFIFHKAGEFDLASNFDA